VKILILNWRDLENPRAGGAEVYTEGFASVLVERGHDVTLFTSDFGGARESVSNGIRVVRRGSRFSVYRHGRNYVRAFGHDFDVIIDEVNTRPFLAHNYTTTPSVALIHQIAKEVWFYEAPLPIAIAGRFFLEPMWLKKYRSRLVMTDSLSSSESLEQYGIKGAVPLPIGAPSASAVSEGLAKQRAVIFVGRMVKSKRPSHVIEAFVQVRKAHPDIELWMVGDGPELDKLKRSNPEGVTFFGKVSRKRRDELMAIAEVLVMTSVREGWGLTVSEASVLGTPTIGYSSPGLVDSIPASNGVLVDSNPSSLAIALEKFFSGELKLTATPHIVTWEQVADAVERLLSEEITSRR